MINNKDSGTILPSNLRTGQEIRIFYCKFRAWPYIIRDNVSLGTPVELVPFGNIFHFTIFELKSQNRDFNSLLCEIFTYLAVKLGKSGIQSNSMRLTDRLVLAINRQSRLPIYKGRRTKQIFSRHPTQDSFLLQKSMESVVQLKQYLKILYQLKVLYFLVRI